MRPGVVMYQSGRGAEGNSSFSERAWRVPVGVAGLLALGSMLLALSLPVAARAAAVDAPDPAAVDSYREAFEVSAATATANLAVQERASGIVGQLQAALGDA